MIKSNRNNPYTSRTPKLVRLVRLMTVQVKVLFSAMFKEIAGTREITQQLISDSTLGEVLNELARKYGKDFKTIVDSKTRQIGTETLVMLNGQSMRKTDVQLKDGDIIMISVPIGGG
jgi:MoaD family protein